MALLNKLKKLLFPFSLAENANDERIKRFFISICIAMMVPVALFFGTRSLLHHHLAEGLVVLTIGIILATLTILLNRTSAYNVTIRFFIIALSALLFYELYIGGGNGAAFLWFYIFPSSITFLLGFREGKYWVAVQAIVISVFVFGKIGHDYPVDMSVRFIAVYMVVAVLSSTLEYLRKKYLDQLIFEKKQLEKAFDEIRILKGMVPICSSCKKIRDDKGFWTQIESYIKTNSDVEFSHGICPDCATKLFPGVGKGKKREHDVPPLPTED